MILKNFDILSSKKKQEIVSNSRIIETIMENTISHTSDRGAQDFINNLSFRFYSRENMSVPPRPAIVDKIMIYHQISKHNF